MSSRTWSLGWLANGQMLGGALLGYLLIRGVLGLFSAAAHEGPGLIYYDEGAPRKASEREYKRHEYSKYGLILVMGGAFWVIAASVFRKQAALETAEKEYEVTYGKVHLARLTAFARAIDPETRQHAYAQADSSAEYQTAKRISDEAYRTYDQARRATREE